MIRYPVNYIVRYNVEGKATLQLGPKSLCAQFYTVVFIDNFTYIFLQEKNALNNQSHLGTILSLFGYVKIPKFNFGHVWDELKYFSSQLFVIQVELFRLILYTRASNLFLRGDLS